MAQDPVRQVLTEALREYIDTRKERVDQLRTRQHGELQVNRRLRLQTEINVAELIINNLGELLTGKPDPYANATEETNG